MFSDADESVMTVFLENVKLFSNFLLFTTFFRETLSLLTLYFKP